MITLLSCGVCLAFAVLTTFSVYALLSPFTNRRDKLLATLIVVGTWGYFALICLVLA